MQWKTLALSLLVKHGMGQAMSPMMRFECSQLVVERLDPLVNPGSVPSPHLHQIVGGNSFNASMTHDLPTVSTCTSCTFSEDFSNYWTAVLYFRARNGTFKRVPQFVSEGLRGIGGITVYYIPSTNNKTTVTAFKPGFRMLVGDAASNTLGPDRKVCHRCMPASGDNSNINCGAPDSQTLPTGFCVGGIRTIITFPTCWDGKNLDSPDHKSHVTYATGSKPNDVGPTGSCPASHPVVIPQVMYEVMWDVSFIFPSLIYLSSRGPPLARFNRDIVPNWIAMGSVQSDQGNQWNLLANSIYTTDPTFQRSGVMAGGWFAAVCLEYWRPVSLCFFLA
jgi:hypothetical protein